MKTIATDSNNYFAKATLPANGWRSGWLSYSDAIAAAKKFVSDWQEAQFDARATVFYRDGACAVEIGGDTEPDADLNRMEHDERGDN